MARKTDKENRTRVKVLASVPVTKNADLTQTMSNVGRLENNQVLHETKALAYRQYEEKTAEYLRTKLTFDFAFQQIYDYHMDHGWERSRDLKDKRHKQKKTGKARVWQEEVDKGWTKAMNQRPLVLQNYIQTSRFSPEDKEDPFKSLFDKITTLHNYTNPPLVAFPPEKKQRMHN